jgi:hypothetical protein
MWNYVLDVRTRAVAARLELNDVPRWDRPGKAFDSFSGLVNPWIVPGRNSLRVAIDWPAGESYEPGQVRVELTLTAQSTNPGTPESRVLARAEWPGKAKEAYPASVALEFDVPEAPPSQLWPKAAPIKLTPLVQSEIRNLATRLHEALFMRNVDMACELFNFCSSDVARTLYRSTDAARATYRDMLSDLLRSDSDAELQPFHTNELELHPVAGSRAIWVTGPDRAKAIQWRSSEGANGMSLYVAPIDGAWTIVR